jgi:hypothetical protein
VRSPSFIVVLPSMDFRALPVADLVETLCC